MLGQRTPFALGITRPDVNNSYAGKGIFQLTERHSLHFGYQYDTIDRENIGIGNFVLPERGTNSNTRNRSFDMRQISVLSERAVHEIKFIWKTDHSQTNPITNGVAINVPGAFNGGGAQDRNQTSGQF